MVATCFQMERTNVGENPKESLLCLHREIHRNTLEKRLLADFKFYTVSPINPVKFALITIESHIGYGSSINTQGNTKKSIKTELQIYLNPTYNPYRVQVYHMSHIAGLCIVSSPLTNRRLLISACHTLALRNATGHGPFPYIVVMKYPPLICDLQSDG